MMNGHRKSPTMIDFLLYRPGSGGPHPPPRLPFPLPLTGGLFPRFDYHHHYYYDGNDDNGNDSFVPFPSYTTG